MKVCTCNQIAIAKGRHPDEGCPENGAGEILEALGTLQAVVLAAATESVAIAMQRSLGALAALSLGDRDPLDARFLADLNIAILERRKDCEGMLDEEPAAEVAPPPHYDPAGAGWSATPLVDEEVPAAMFLNDERAVYGCRSGHTQTCSGRCHACGLSTDIVRWEQS